MSKEISPESRSSQMRANYAGLERIVKEQDVNESRDQELRSAVLQCANIGVWAKLNLEVVRQFEDPNLRVVFTGQQPTLNYGLLRRVAKRSSPYESLITVHTHADHDKAGKNGFGSVELPFYNSRGEIEYRKYDLCVEYDEHSLMSEVKAPTFKHATEFFDRLILDASQSKFGDKHEIDALRRASIFILDNLTDIRSAGEFNAVLQTYLTRTVAPEIKSIDFMLSDFLKTDAVRRSFGEFVVNLPNWITAYNQAASEFSGFGADLGYRMPQPLKNENDGEKQINELPVWVIDNNGKRQRAWLRQSGDYCEIGYYNEDEFVFCLDFNTSDSADIVNGKQNFPKLSPAAVALTDLMRVRLQIPTIHGETGHFYDLINERVQEILSNNISPVASASEETRLRGKERKAINAHTLQLIAAVARLNEEASQMNRQKAEIFNELKAKSAAVFEKNGLDQNIKIASIAAEHTLFGVFQEIDRFYLLVEEAYRENGAEIDYKKGPKLIDFLSSCNRIFAKLGKEKVIMLIGSLQKVSSLIEDSEDYFQTSEKLFDLAEKQKQINEDVAQLKAEMEKYEKRLGSDEPLISTVLYNPNRLKALYRLQRIRVRIQ